MPVSALKDVEIAYDLTSLPADVDRLTSSEVRRQALQHRPDVLAALSDYAASESALQLEIAKQYPDIHLNTGYEYDQGLQKWGLLGFGVELPLLNRNEGPIAEAEARRKQAAARFEALQARVIADLDRALAVYRGGGEKPGRRGGAAGDAAEAAGVGGAAIQGRRRGPPGRADGAA